MSWVRPASAADTSRLAALHAECFAEPWSTAAFEQLLQHPNAFALLAGDSPQAEPSGFILVRLAADEAEILSLGVRPGSRRSGVARQLTRAGAAEAEHRSASRLFLEVNVNNAAARGLYGQLGFAEAGRRRGYYQAPGRHAEDALILSSALPLPAWESVGNSTNLRT
jgi:ribosomal-protein-alanine N-acetyltransferase